ERTTPEVDRSHFPFGRSCSVLERFWARWIQRLRSHRIEAPLRRAGVFFRRDLTPGKKGCGCPDRLLGGCIIVLDHTHFCKDPKPPLWIRHNQHRVLAGAQRLLTGKIFIRRLVLAFPLQQSRQATAPNTCWLSIDHRSWTR